MKNKQYFSGQGLVEVVLSIGIIVLVLTGVVALLNSSLKVRTAGFDRKKGAELGQKVMEMVIEENKTDPSSFWNDGSAYWTGIKNTKFTADSIGYPGFSYTVSYDQNTTATGCNGGFNCIEVSVVVEWKDAVDQSLTFSRFFSKK